MKRHGGLMESPGSHRNCNWTGWLAVVAAVMVLLCPLPGRTQEPTLDVGVREEPPARLFRIGFQRREVTGHPGTAYLEALRRAIAQDAELVRLMTLEGYSGIGLFPCDGPYDMLRRLRAGEFDMAFTPAIIYAQHQSGYTAILKSRRPEDSFSANDRVWRQGVVFVSPRCPLFQDGDIDKKELAEYLEQNRLAVVSTQSVAGFQAPLLRLAVDYEITSSDGGYLWFDSSEEVVKCVLSGLADIGACDESALVRVLQQAGLENRRDELVRVILRTDPVTTDPVIVRSSLSPRISTLGLEMRRTIEEFARAGGFGDIRYSQATDQEYRSVIELNREFTERVGELAR